MELKTILEQESYSRNTSLLGYEFDISADRSVYNAIRNKYKKLAIEARAKFAKMYKQLTDINDLLDNVPDAFVVAIEDALLEVLKDIISVDIYTIDKDKVIELAFNGWYFDSFLEPYNDIYNKVGEIIAQVDSERYMRELRKESRSRWTSATIGGSAISAWSNQLETAGMNLLEGAVHSVANAIGNAATESWANGELDKLYKSKLHKEGFLDGVYYSCFNLHLLLIDIVRVNSGIYIGGTISDSDEQKAQAMFNNFMAINLDEEKKAKFINEIFHLNPYNRDFYKALIEKCGDKDKDLEAFGEFCGMNIFEIKNEILVEFVKANLGKTESDAKKCRKNMEIRAEEIGLDPMQITKANEIIVQRLEKLDREYRTVDGVVLDTRDEADLAREELKKIKEIMKSVVAPTKESTVSYENDLLDKRDAIDKFQTPVKNKYLKKIDEYLKDFDKKFRGEGAFMPGLSREEAGNEKALRYVRNLPVSTYEELDKAREMLVEYLPEVGITLKQATLANDYFARCENKLNTVDGVLFESREAAAFGRKEFAEISEIMKSVTAPTYASLLPYEKELIDVKAKLEKFTTDIKNKYIAKIDRYLVDFDNMFRTNMFSKFETRKEAAIFKSCDYVKKLAPVTYEDIDNAKVKLKEYVVLVGIEYEEAETAHQFLQQCYLKANTVDGIVFATKDEADFGRQEFAEISAIMSTVTPPTKDSLLSYERNLFEVREKLGEFKTDIKNKYIALINNYLEKFDNLFKQIGLLKKAETRQEAAQDKALKHVKAIAPVTCGYDEIDKATESLNALLPEIGIELEQAFAATQYLQQQENRNNTVDGVVMSSRDETALAKSELPQIQNIMSMVVPPTNESLLDYERNLLGIKADIDKFITPVKNKYLGIVQKHLNDFDDKFRRVSLLKVCATREEAGAERALKFVKSKTYNIVDDVERARNELKELLPNLGITLEQATAATTHLTNVENKLNGVSTGSKLGGFMNRFKK